MNVDLCYSDFNIAGLSVSTMMEMETAGITRLRVTIHGVVQGVGFRPFVHRLANELQLRGWIENSPQGVCIEAEGGKETLEEFLTRIIHEKPPHSSVQSIESSYLDPVYYTRFSIRNSSYEGTVTTLVLPDVATCPECLREMLDPANRRYRYPFINCTHCGPRFSIIQALPYDRISTTMKQFEMCDECRNEYENPEDRRFHAQPIACSRCGPHVELWRPDGTVAAKDDDALALVAQYIRQGMIVAVKGLGGFHLMVDARNADAVVRLRNRKRREAKPLAVMFPSLQAVREECELSPMEERILHSSVSPIVLLRRRSRKTSTLAESVAPGNPYSGAMIPYTPLHHLLMNECDFPVIATSGNMSDEPICIDEHEALQRLGDIADLFLVHNRPIQRHVDDSVVRVMLGREQVLRRARGYAPLPLMLKQDIPPMLSVGAHQKNSVAVSRGRNVFISQHIGDLETHEALNAFRTVVHDLRMLVNAIPETVITDLHPDYLSTQYAKDVSMPSIDIQHHIAHVGACMAENELESGVLGVSWDGTGLGTDGTIWGGEFFRVDSESFKRVATFRTFSLPGGSAASREPRRSALGLLYAILGEELFSVRDLFPVSAFSHTELQVVQQMLSHNVNAPQTSSVGRLFDAVASITNLSQRVSYEGEAAMALEYAINDGDDVQSFYQYVIEPSERDPSLSVVDWAPMIVGIVHDTNERTPISSIARTFHNTLAEIIVDVARRFGLNRVAMTGGCFQNKYLTERAVERLRSEGFATYWHQRIPPNDGGISVGQIFCAARFRSVANDVSDVDSEFSPYILIPSDN